MIKVTLSVGGSILIDKESGSCNIDNFKKISNFIEELRKNDIGVGVCVGGGLYARKYIEIVKELNLHLYHQHYIGMMITNVNAKLLSFYLKNAVYTTDFIEAEKLINSGKVPVMGGIVPGFTTDYDTAILSSVIKAKYLINITDVEGVYDKDPRKYRDAKLIEKLSFKEFFDISKDFEGKPGVNFVFDPRAAKICEENGIKIIIANINNLDEVLEFIIGRRDSFRGSLIQ